MASQVFGSLLAAIVLESYNLITFYLVMACLAAVSGVIFFFLKEPLLTHSTPVTQLNTTRYEESSPIKNVSVSQPQPDIQIEGT